MMRTYLMLLNAYYTLTNDFLKINTKCNNMINQSNDFILE